jgi:2-haloacid dehalogenase
MKHTLFLFDLDDTLLDFKASEQRSFALTLGELGMRDDIDALFADYQAINLALWKSFETGAVSKDFLKVERFRKAFAQHGLELDPEAASRLYLESLSNTVVLIDGAVRLCATLAAIGEVGIITNGVEQIQQRRIASSGLGDYISFIATSESCGHAKPDSRFFQYTAAMARLCVARDHHRRRPPGCRHPRCQPLRHRELLVQSGPAGQRVGSGAHLRSAYPARRGAGAAQPGGSLMPLRRQRACRC